MQYQTSNSAVCRASIHSSSAGRTNAVIRPVGLLMRVAGAGKVGVGAAADTTVLVKTVKAGIADDADGLNATTVNAARSVDVKAIAVGNDVRCNMNGDLRREFWRDTAQQWQTRQKTGLLHRDAA